MVEGGMKCVKMLLFGFNLIFVICAIALIAAGAYVQIQLHDYFDLIGGKFSSAAALLIAVGVLIFIIAAFGCLGSCKENYICVMIFGGLLVVIFIMEIGAGIAGFIYYKQVEDWVEKELILKEKTYHPDSQWDGLQREFQCCGVVNYTEWLNLPELKLNSSVPLSCFCEKASDVCKQVKDVVGMIYFQGCLTKFSDWIGGNIYTVGGVGIGLAFIQIIGIVLSCCLARSIKKEYEVV